MILFYFIMILCFIFFLKKFEIILTIFYVYFFYFFWIFWNFLAKFFFLYIYYLHIFGGALYDKDITLSLLNSRHMLIRSRLFIVTGHMTVWEATLIKIDRLDYSPNLYHRPTGDCPTGRLALRWIHKRLSSTCSPGRLS